MIGTMWKYTHSLIKVLIENKIFPRGSAEDKRSPSRQMRPITTSGDPTSPQKSPDGWHNSR